MADDAEQHEPAPAAVVGRLSTLPCFHCAAPSSKYRCPLCSHSLCSLPCSKTHACVATKVRSELVFTPLGHITEMTESVFVRDVRLLNETARCVDNAVRDRKRTAEDIVARRKSARIASAAKPSTTSREQQPNHNNQQQQHQQRKQKTSHSSAEPLLKRSPGAAMNPIQLHNRAKQRGIGDFRSMSSGMSRHELNRSTFDPATRTLFWQLAVELCFVATEHHSHISEFIYADSAQMSAILTDIITLLRGKIANFEGFDREISDQTKVAILLRLENRPANNPAFRHIDPNETLNAALHGTTIIEFPSLLLVHADKLASYTIEPRSTLVS